MFRITDDIKELIESGAATVVCTGDREGRPHVAYGWAPRVRGEGTVDVFLDKGRADQTLSNLKETGQIAVTSADVISVRSVQLKGVYVDSGEANEADQKWVQDDRAAFVANTALIGDPPSLTSKLWLEDVVRVSFEVRQAFDQTPGPEAGKQL